jgi:hypothetical protein
MVAMTQQLFANSCRNYGCARGAELEEPMHIETVHPPVAVEKEDWGQDCRHRQCGSQDAISPVYLHKNTPRSKLFEQEIVSLMHERSPLNPR